MDVLPLIEELTTEILISVMEIIEIKTGNCRSNFFKSLSFRNNHVLKHTQYILLLFIVYRTIKNKVYITKRSIYYENPRIFESQCVIDRVLNRLCTQLDVNRLHLNTVATCKSMVYGDIWLHTAGKHLFSFKSSKQGVGLICTHFDSNDILCSAKFVLVVEKDATFQKIMTSGFYEEFQPCILITSKGYPDLATRSFLCKLHHKYPHLPIFALVDADPHGMGIYLSYKYGSKKAALKPSYTLLSIPSLKLLGVLPSELSMLQVRQQDLLKLSEPDRLMIQSIRKRSYLEMESNLITEIEYMESTQLKAEIQCLENLGTGFLCSEYLPRKLKSITNDIELP